MPVEIQRRTVTDLFWQGTYYCAFRLARAWWFVRRPSHSGALVAIWADHEIVAVKPAYRSTLCLPGGGIHSGEEARDAAVREVAEELGLALPRCDLSLIDETVGIVEHRKSHVSLFEITLPQGAQIHADGREIAWAGFVSVDALLRLKLDPYLRHYLEIKQGASL